MIPYTQDKVQQIGQLVAILSPEEQDVLLRGLRRQVLMKKAIELTGTARPNKFTMQDIVNEVWQVRAERYAR
jgi:hypothetical protein